MSLSATNMSKALLKAYSSEINNENSTSVGNKTTGIDQNKLMQKVAFEMMLQQMIDNMGDSSMADFVGAALEGNNGDYSSNSLNLAGSLNSNVRNLNSLQNKYSSYSGNLSKLGLADSKYESNLNPGAISNTPGDFGGKSYGAWQFSSKTGSLNSFINSLKESSPVYYSRLTEAKAKDGNSFGANFDAAWTSIAKTDKDGFLGLQQKYIGQAYYDNAAKSLKSKYGFDINTKSDALKESLWSTVVQHGVGGTLSIFSKLNLNNSDRGIINDLYNERQKVDVYFRSSSEKVKQSVYNRFSRERVDMLNLLDGR